MLIAMRIRASSPNPTETPMTSCRFAELTEVELESLVGGGGGARASDEEDVDKEEELGGGGGGEDLDKDPPESSSEGGGGGDESPPSTSEGGGGEESEEDGGGDSLKSDGGGCEESESEGGKAAKESAGEEAICRLRSADHELPALPRKDRSRQDQRAPGSPPIFSGSCQQTTHRNRQACKR